MKLIATLAADLERSPLGTRSRLADELGGKPILRRTVERVLRITGVDAVFVLAPAAQLDRVSRLLAGLEARVEPLPDRAPAYAALVRAGRVWGLDGWRGGIGGACVFDEDIHVAASAALADREQADAVVSIPAAAAVVDPAMIDALIHHHREQAPESQLSFVQAPPGLAAVVLGRSLLTELAPVGQPPGLVLAYRPDQPASDLTGKEPCFRAGGAVMEARGRLICDTRRSWDRVASLLDAGGEAWNAARICQWLDRQRETHVASFPEEIEIELTTDDPSGDGALLRPRGDRVGRRGPMTLEVLRQVAGLIGEHDDVRIVLGGFGEPCCHPQFGEACRILRESGALAIAVRTGGLVANDAVEAALFETPVDVVEVTLDATTAAGYRRVTGADRFDEVSARVHGWLERRLAGSSVVPLIVPSFVKSRETLPEMEAFFDHWMRQLGMVLVTGYSHCAGQLPDRAVTSTAPPRRGPCVRTFSRTMILADGRVTTCDQDFAGRQTLGRIGEAAFEELWRGQVLSSIRGGEIGAAPLCGSCDQWHRP